MQTPSKTPAAEKAAKHFRKEKAGFWCPGDIDTGIQNLIDEGIFKDRSKAIVALLRIGLGEQAGSLSPALQERVEALGQLLERDPKIVIQQCVAGILEMIDQGIERPLVLQEIALRNLRRKE